MKTNCAAYILISLFASGLACSPSDNEPAITPPPESTAAEEVTDNSEVRPPLITAMPPQPPGPPPQTVQRLPKPTFIMPNASGDIANLADARAKARFYIMDADSPVINGNFERWEKPGPIHWDGNFTYKKAGDPPEIDIQMYPMKLDGEWALRFMPKGTYIELWQDVKLPEVEGGIALEAIAYVQNPVPTGFAIRITYFADDMPHVAEIYPAQADKEWTRYHARINLPADVGRKSVRIYLTRDASIDQNVIVDGVSVKTVGVSGTAPASPPRTN